MSMYNALFGMNPLAGQLLSLLGLSADDVGRFRDAYVAEGGNEIHVFTRNGGGNREGYMPDFSAHPHYVRDFDDGFDSTYATIVFRTPEPARPLLTEIAALNKDTLRPMERLEQLLTDLKSGTKNADTERALRVCEPIFAAIKKQLDSTKGR